MYPLKSKYKVGDKIRINHLEDAPNYDGREGVIDHIDDMGMAHGTWGWCSISNDDDVSLIE